MSFEGDELEELADLAEMEVPKAWRCKVHCKMCGVVFFATIRSIDFIVVDSNTSQFRALCPNLRCSQRWTILFDYEIPPIQQNLIKIKMERQKVVMLTMQKAEVDTQLARHKGNIGLLEQDNSRIKREDDIARAEKVDAERLARLATGAESISLGKKEGK